MSACKSAAFGVDNGDAVNDGGSAEESEADAEMEVLGDNNGSDGDGDVDTVAVRNVDTVGSKIALLEGECDDGAVGVRDYYVDVVDVTVVARVDNGDGANVIVGPTVIT